jgi:hypothetical protein
LKERKKKEVRESFRTKRLACELIAPRSADAPSRSTREQLTIENVEDRAAQVGRLEHRIATMIVELLD